MNGFIRTTKKIRGRTTRVLVLTLVSAGFAGQGVALAHPTSLSKPAGSVTGHKVSH